jgi:hypothetical protein
MAEATVATQFETLTSAAQECDVIVAATALQVARSVAEKLGTPYVFAASGCCRRRIMHDRPCRPYLDRLRPRRTTTVSCGHRMRNGERF